MTDAASKSKLGGIVKFFETHPPSHALFALATLFLFLIGGLALTVPFLIGIALAGLGHALDIYGVRERE